MWYWGDCGASSKCHSTKMACPTPGGGCWRRAGALWDVWYNYDSFFESPRGFGKAVNFWKVDMVWRWGKCWNTSLTFWEPDHIEQLSLVFFGSRLHTVSCRSLDTRQHILSKERRIIFDMCAFFFRHTSWRCNLRENESWVCMYMKMKCRAIVFSLYVFMQHARLIHCANI